MKLLLFRESGYLNYTAGKMQNYAVVNPVDNIVSGGRTGYLIGGWDFYRKLLTVIVWNRNLGFCEEKYICMYI